MLCLGRLLTFIAPFAIVLFANFSYASECKEIRLDSPGRSMSRIPVMDQDSKWICYAYTASQMVDAWRFSHGDKDYNHITSPPATAVFYASQRTDYASKDVDYGWQSDAVASVVKNGSCDYKAIYNKFGQKGLSEYFGELKKYFDEFQVKAYQQSIDTNKNIAYRARDYANNKVGEIKYARAVQCAMRSANSETPIPGIFEITDALSQPSYLKYLEKLFKPVCQKNLKKVDAVPAAKKVWMRDFSEKERVEKVQKQINEQFNSKNPQPMGINYCANVLYDKNVQGMYNNGEFNWNACDSHHISVVIGQRPTSDGRCEFLIRNSSGQSCNAYPDWKCENGQIWVDSSTLIKNLNGISWLEDK